MAEPGFFEDDDSVLHFEGLLRSTLGALTPYAQTVRDWSDVDRVARRPVSSMALTTSTSSPPPSSRQMPPSELARPDPWCVEM